MKPKSFSIKTRGQPSKYNPDRHPIDVYLLARDGKTNNGISEALGVDASTFEGWVKGHEAIRYSLLMARNFLDENGKSSVEVFRSYVYKQLPPDLREHWDYIETWCEHRNGQERIEALLAPHGTAVRQSLWMHAMIACDFNQPEACRKVNVPYQTLKDWMTKDANFAKILDHVLWCKKQFFEGSLIKLVNAGNTLATIFANRSVNKETYSERIDVNHKHSGTVNLNAAVHVTWSIDKLDLPRETMRTILDAIRAAKKAIPIEAPMIEEAEVRHVAPLRPGRMALAALGDDE